MFFTISSYSFQYFLSLKLSLGDLGLNWFSTSSDLVRIDFRLTLYFELSSYTHYSISFESYDTDFLFASSCIAKKYIR